MQIKKTNAENKYMYNKILIVKHIENEGAGTLETFFKGRGFVPVILELTKGGKEDPFFKNISHKFNVFQWHEDMFELPKKSTLLSVSDTEVSQAFKYGENAYGFQFHIEATPQMIEGWLKNELLSRERSKIILESYKNKVEYERRAQIIYTNFLKVL